MIFPINGWYLMGLYKRYIPTGDEEYLLSAFDIPLNAGIRICVGCRKQLELCWRPRTPRCSLFTFSSCGVSQNAGVTRFPRGHFFYSLGFMNFDRTNL